jgi:hypothetical protein
MPWYAECKIGKVFDYGEIIRVGKHYHVVYSKEQQGVLITEMATVIAIVSKDKAREIFHQPYWKKE